MKVQIDLPEIPGYEYTGEYRHGRAGEMVCNGKESWITEGPTVLPVFIIRKLDPKPTYRPFKDNEEMKPHRERWVNDTQFGNFFPLWYAYLKFSTDYLVKNWIFEDTGEPVGVKE